MLDYPLLAAGKNSQKGFYMYISFKDLHLEDNVLWIESGGTVIINNKQASQICWKVHYHEINNLLI